LLTFSTAHPFEEITGPLTPPLGGGRIGLISIVSLIMMLSYLQSNQYPHLFLPNTLLRSDFYVPKDEYYQSDDFPSHPLSSFFTVVASSRSAIPHQPLPMSKLVHLFPNRAFLLYETLILLGFSEWAFRKAQSNFSASSRFSASPRSPQ